jgi:hypothetical protein
MQRLRVLKHRIERRPMCWWYAAGKRMFPNLFPLRCHRMGQFGNYTQE